ncbi:YebC/PmpR family DNA-binding transcriptional regulator [Candidatus Dojkabacteria bacterium]|nr:YebC/PmpR family DNA-binding transcriptional regulator [Candidatus Dojkabacteria bacterium]
MSGHNKWSKIQHKKGLADSKKGKLFSKISREIFIAIAEGDSVNPESNSLLKIAIDKAKQASMPNANIERAINKAAGGEEGAKLERVFYEAYGPFGVALIIETLTDNKNRTISTLRNILNMNGGNIADKGAVMWQFNRVALIKCEKTAAFEDFFDTVSGIEGVVDVTEDKDNFLLIGVSSSLFAIKTALINIGYIVKTSSIEYLPKNIVKSLNSAQINELIDLLMDDDDVINVWHNMQKK